MSTNDGNWSELTKVGESVPINVQGIIISVPIILAKSGSEPVIMGHPAETHPQKYETNLDARGCEIAISAVDWLE